MSTPSIALIPSGYKSGKLYSQLPVNGDGDLTFTRVGNATRVNENGLIEEMATGVPRLDYSDGGCPSLLVEPSSTNLAEYSEDMSNAVWAKTNATITTNSTLAPDGTLTADTLTATSNGGQIQQLYSGSSATEYTVSFWIKRKTGSGVVNIRSVENANIPITITDEWTRVSLTTTSTSTFIRVGINLATSGDEVYIWGSQLEQVVYATSYIPNLTTGGSSRDVEQISKSGLSDYINSREGVLYLELKNAYAEATNRGITLQGASNNGSDLVGFRFNVSNGLNTYIRANGSTIVNGNVATTETDYIKVAVKYKSGDTALWVNGVEVFTDNSNFTFNEDLSVLRIGDGLGGNGLAKYKDIRVYKTALTDTELQTLTS